MTGRVVRVAVPRPLRGEFDYAAPSGPPPAVGARVRVPLGRSEVVGVVTGFAEASEHKLRQVCAVLDDAPLLPPDLIALAAWMSDYYHHPLGEVYATLLPGRARRGAAIETRWPLAWRVAQGAMPALGRAPKQRQAFEALREFNVPVRDAELAALGIERRAVAALARKGLAERLELRPDYRLAPSPHTLNPEQERAASALSAAAGRHGAFVLQGVTGSGKTEVYMRAIAAALERRGQALVLVPEIALTPQALARFTARFGAAAALHSAASDKERLDVWLNCKRGVHRVLVGTRSAVFAPFANLSLIVVDEEHDESFKQREGLRYSARDVAVKRAQLLGVPVVLGSATPSLATLANVARRRYRRLRLGHRATGAALPSCHVIDVRGQRLRAGLSERLIATLRRHLNAGNQVLAFINRRGFAPVWLCAACGWQARCSDCDARLVLHATPPPAGDAKPPETTGAPPADDPPSGGLRCHQCGRGYRRTQVCPDCGGAAFVAVGAGTQRVDRALRGLFPDVPVHRIDRDTARNPALAAERLRELGDGEAAILVGTQMLAKGHHLPGVTLVAVLNADAGFLSPDFRAPERTAQTIVQVAGRAGRAQRPGEVWLQSYDPDNPNLRALIEGGYAAFAAAELEQRRRAGMPPYAAMAVLRGESANGDAAQGFLRAAAARLRGSSGAGDIQVLGPAPAPLARRAGRFRYQCLALAGQRRALHAALAALAASGLKAANVRWSIDVDPYDAS